MEEAEVQKQLQKWGLVAGGLAALFLLNRWRQKRKVKKILKARAKLKARQEKERKEKKRGRAARRAKKKERSMVQQLVRFAVFQFLKKVISEQIRQMEVELGKGKLGKKL
ncbi:MAG: hypothetical protein QME84_03390, partial [Actinomycetota bacterium]|nr:hypothetical protein [Actinomycetota bacterium]